MRSRLLCLLPLLLLPSLAAAFSSSSSGNVTTYGGFTATPANVGKYAISTASDGRVLINSGARMNIPGGGSIPINVAGGASRASAAALIGRGLLRLSAAGAVIQAGFWAYDLAQENGFNLGTSGGQLVVSKPPASDPTYLDPYEYQYAENGWKHSAIAACNDWIAAFSGGGFSWSAPTFTAPSTCRADRTTISNGGTFPQSVVIGRRAQLSAPPPLPDQPSSVQALVDAIAARTTWAPDTALSESVREAILLSDSLDVGEVVVTGPTYSPGPSSTTVDEATGETTTITQTITNVYNGPTVTTTTVTDTVVTNTATGAPVRQSTTTASPVVPQQPSSEEPAPFAMPCGVAGTPPCSVKVDESQTPVEVPADKFKPMLDEGKQAQQDLLNQVKADTDKSFFEPFTDLFVTPALSSCVPLEIPGDRGTIDPCGTVDGARAIMAYIWALSGLALCLHMVRSAL